MTIKECIDIVDNAKPNQYSARDKVMWLSFIDEIIINDVLKTHEGYDGKYDDFEGYTEDKVSVPLIVPSPYDRLYTAYLKMKIDGENGETARYNNSAALFNSYMMEYRKFYNKTHMPLDVTKPQPIQRPKQSNNISDAVYENLKRELYYLLSEDFAEMTSQDKIYDIVMSYVNNNIEMLSNPVAKKAVSSMKTANGTVVSQNADFAEVAEWADGNPNNEDRTGYFVCANVPVDGIIMRKATSADDVKGVSILAPAFAGNYTKDKLDSNGNLLPKYSYVAIIGFVPVRDNGTCTVGGRCMPDDNGCAIPSSNNMGYQVVNRVDENRVLIIIEPNGDMVQRIKSKILELQEKLDNIGGGGGASNSEQVSHSLKVLGTSENVKEAFDAVENYVMRQDFKIQGLETSANNHDNQISGISHELSECVKAIPDSYRVYATKANGELDPKYYTDSATGATIAYRDKNGCCQFGTPTADKHAANKAYVDKAVGGNYELIETIEVTEDMVISRTEEPDGTPYNFKRVRIWIETTATNFALARFTFRSAANLQINYHDFAAFSNKTSAQRCWCEVYPNCGLWTNRQIAWTQYNGYATTQEYAGDFENVVTTEQAPTIGSISTAAKVAAGTTIKIWGVRA